MKAAVLERQGPVETRPLQLTDADTPRPGPRQVLIRAHCCAVCRTDLHIVEGDLPLRRTPVIPGHQAVGCIERLGEGSGRFAIGTRVGVAWLNQACGACRYCASLRENLCVHADFTGWTVDGGYAECIVVPEEFVFSIPAGGDDFHVAPLLCAGVIGYRALRLSGADAGGRLGLYGFGASAHLAIQVARHWGCEVHVFTRRESNRQLARSLGAAVAGDAADALAGSLDAAVIFAPAGELVSAALSALRPGGTVALSGIHMSSIPALDYAKHLYQERTLRSVANATRRDAEELLELAARIPIRTTIRTFPLARANEALLALKTGAITGAAVLDCRQ